MNAAHGAISAATREAKQVGEEMLASGGNAFDAIVASAVALAVTEPGNSGLGGEGYCVFYDARAAQAGSLCFMSVPGEAATPGNLLGKDLRRGVNASLVPAAVAGWFALISEKCSRPAEDLIAPAIRLAEDGFEVGDMAGALNWMGDQFHPSARDIFTRSGRPWQPVDRLRQPELAQTLELIAAGGEQAFYSGHFAERMDQFFRETGGMLRKEDLTSYRPLWQKTLSRRFGEVEVHVPPPESTGFSVLYGLELLARLGYHSMPTAELPAVQTVVSVLQEMGERVDEIAARLTPYDSRVEAFIARLFEEGELAKASKRLSRNASGCGPCSGSHTTSLSACDSIGNLVCLTQTLDHGFGSGIVIPGTGVLMNNGMAWLNTDANTNRADVVAPHKRSFVPVIPTLALSTSGRPLFALGTPGGFGIPQTTLQVYANILFHGDDLRSAVGRPRLTMGAIIPEDGPNQKVHLEPGFAPEAHAQFQADVGNDFEFFGRFHGVMLNPEGSADAVDDPRA